MGSFEQNEALTTRLGNIIKDYNAAQTLQELLQNCDDARAPHVTFLLDKRSARETGWSLKSLQETSSSQLAANPSTESLIIQKNSDADWLMQQFSGPALYQYDYGVFEPEDFASLSNLGDGRKKCDPTKTGKFCLGVNCVYHLTDLPCFASGHHCVFLEPHKRVFACKDGEMQSAVGGWKFDTSDPSINEVLGPIFEPFRCTFDPLPHPEYVPWDPNGGHWHGTVFRLPLRRANDTGRSMIMEKCQGAARVMTPDQVEKEVLEPFMENAVEQLLFMRSVESITIYVWEEGAAKAEQIFSLSITDLDSDRRILRKQMVTFVKQEMQRFEREVELDKRNGKGQKGQNESFLRFMRSLRSRLKEAPRVLLPLRMKTSRKGSDPVIDHWALSTMIGSEGEIDFAIAEQYDNEDGPALTDQCMWPYAAVAAHLASGVEQNGCYVQRNRGRMPRTNGMAFCTLPTRIRTGLPIHVDGRWELKLDRNNLVLDHTCHGTDMQRTHWNYVLLERVVAVAYARLLQALAMPPAQCGTLRNWLSRDKIRLQSQDFYRLFPQSPKNKEDFFAGVAKPLFNLLADPCGASRPVKIGDKIAVPQGLTNFQRAWSFFFDCEADAIRGVQFLRIMEASEQCEDVAGHEDAARVFARFDKDGSGFLSKDQLRHALREVMDESAVEDLDFEQLWVAADKSLDGFVDETEFLQAMSVDDESDQPTLKRTSSGRSPKADRMVSDVAFVLKRKNSAQHETIEDRDEFSVLQGVSFRLVGVDRAIASCFAMVDDVLSNKGSDASAVPQRWAKAKTIMYRLFGSAGSVEDSLLRLGMKLTDAPPEVFDELHSFGAKRVRPSHVRNLLRIAEGLYEWPEVQAGSHGFFIPVAQLPKPLESEQAMLSLLMYCLSDHHTNDKALVEMLGCALLPLQDGSIALVPGADAQRPLLIDTDAFAVGKRSDKPFGRLLIETPQQFLTRPASLVVSALDVTKSLGCAMLSPEELSKCFESVFPVDWKMRDWIPAHDITNEVREKLRVFWQFLRWYRNSVESPRPLRHFKDWPLLEVTDGRLIKLEHVDVVLSWPSADQDREIVTVFERIGVPLVTTFAGHDSDMTQMMVEVLREDLPSALPELQNAQQACKALLHWVTKQPFPDLHASDKHALLQLLTRAQPDEQQLNQVRSLPYFEILEAPGEFAKLNVDCSYYTMADFSIDGFEVKTGSKESFCFLKEPQPEWSPLYVKLNVTKLPREVFYVEYCFKSFQNLPDDVRLALFSDIRANFEQVRDRSVGGTSFQTLLQDAKLFGCRHDSFVTVCDLLDPKDEFVQQDLMLGLESRLPPLSLRSEDWLRVLQSWGMPMQLPMRTLLEAAKAIEQREDLDAAKALLLYFTGCYASLQKQEDPATWELLLHEFSQLKLIPNEQQRRQHCRAPGLKLPQPSDHMLAPLRGSRLLNKCTFEPALVWSQETLVYWPGPLPPNDAIEALGLLQGEPRLKTVLKQYALAKAEIERQIDIGGAVRGIRELEALYEFFNDVLRASPKSAEKLNVAGIARDIACVFVDTKSGTHQWKFVKPDIVFTGLRILPLHGVDMHLLSYSSPLRRCYDLRQHMGIRYEPSPGELMEALQMLERKLQQSQREGERQELITSQLQKSMITISDLLAASVLMEYSQTEELLLIDEQFRVAPVRKLLMNDTPWLKDRLHLNALPLLHKSLHGHGRQLGVGLLSEVVYEELVSTVPIAHEKLQAQFVDQLSRWEKLCRSPEFRSGLWRLQLEAATRRKLSHEAQQNMKLRLYELSQIEFFAVSEIASKFLVWEQNVTTMEVGSPSFIGLAGHKLCIYLVQPPNTKNTLRSWQRELTMQLDRYFLCNNSFAVSEILRATYVEDIGTLLDEMRIPVGVLDENEQLAGMRVHDTSWLVQDSNSSEMDLSGAIGSLVAVNVQSARSTESSELRFALLCDLRSSNSIHVDAGPAIGVVTLARESVWMLKSKTEMAEEQKRAFEDLQLETKATEISPTNEAELQQRNTSEKSKIEKTAAHAAHKSDADSGKKNTDSKVVPKSTAATPPESKSELLEYCMDEDWFMKETELRQKMKENRGQRMEALVKEPKGVGIRDIAFKDVGDDIQAQYGEENPELKELFLSEAKVGVRSSIGYDLILIGNFDEEGRSPEEFAFYHHRPSVGDFGSERKMLVAHCCRVVREIAEKVFRYPVYNIGLFYQEKSASRFIRQNILLNLWPIDAHCRENKIPVADLDRVPFAYLYIYGLLIHKLAHFFDLVHGTRHDFYMNEIRIEHLMEWLELLESKGWDPAALEKQTYKSGENYTKLLLDVVL